MSVYSDISPGVRGLICGIRTARDLKITLGYQNSESREVSVSVPAPIAMIRTNRALADGSRLPHSNHTFRLAFSTSQIFCILNLRNRVACGPNNHEVSYGQRGRHRMKPQRSKENEQVENTSIEINLDTELMVRS
jgi:hypothetical protein